MATKTTTVVADDVTLTAGAGDQTHNITIDEGYGALASIKLTNGSTGPTIAAQTQIQVSNDGTNFFDFGGALQGDTGNNDISSWSVEIPIGVQRLRFVSGSNTGQAVTLRLEISNVSAV